MEKIESADGDTVIDLALERAKAGMKKVDMPIEITFYKEAMI